MKVVSDTGPLIALAKINHITLLRALFDFVSIPAAVHAELFTKTSLESNRLNAALAQGIIRTTVCDTVSADIYSLIARLNKGEQEAIVLAYQHQALLLIDERQGRQATRALAIRMTGTVGVLLLAKQRGLVSAVLPLLHELRQYGYWLSDEVLASAAQLAGEG